MEFPSSMVYRVLSASVVAMAVAVIAVGCGSHRDALGLTVTPSSALADAPLSVRVTGLEGGERVTIAVLGKSHLGKPWRTVLKRLANSRGQVDLLNQYLVARLRPEQKPSGDDYFPYAQSLTIVARSRAGSATAHAERILMPSSVTVTDERPSRVGFYGEWFTPRGTRKHTAVLLLGGSEGGLPKSPPHTLAAHGYPVLALAYFREPGLPKNLKNIPLEYFRRALIWMRGQPEVDPQHIITFGISRGGELSLILSSTFRNLVHGAVDYVGADVAMGSLPLSQPAWTYHGRPVPIIVPLARIAGPVFAVGGGDDPLTSSATIEDIQRQLRGHDRRDRILIYPHAGHLVGQAVPNVPELSTTVKVYYGKMYLGGSPQADEAAREDSWPRLLHFLAELNQE
jgi:dienelactone hydrolase